MGNEAELKVQFEWNSEKSGRTLVAAIVDTGAGRNYIQPTRERYGELHIRKGKPLLVQVADGREVLLENRVSVHLGLLDMHNRVIDRKEVELYVFPPEDGTKGQKIILGRQGIRRFDIHTSPGRVYTGAGKVLTETVDHCNRVGDSDSDGTQDHLDKVVRDGWTPLIRAHGYQCRLRRLRDDEAKDTEDQTHAFEVAVPRPTGIGSSEFWKVEGAAKAHCKRMGAELREQADAMIQEYLDRGFWRETALEQCQTAAVHAPTPIFMIGGGSGKKLRIVCDFQGVNSTIPAAGNESSGPSQLLAALRLCGPEVVAVSDAEKAFYKIRLVDHANGNPVFMWLTGASCDEHGRVTVRHFLTDRMAFGLSFGPAGLVTTMRMLFTRNDRLFRGHLGWYIDDLCQGGAMDDVLHDLAVVNEILGKCGHKIQPTKTGLIVHPSKRSELPEPYTDTQVAKSFNAELSFGDAGLLVKCDRAKRDTALCCLGSIDPAIANLSKADYFAHAGSLGYDLVKAHPEEKVLADVVRSLVGKEFSNEPWHTPLDWSGVDQRKIEALGLLVEWASELALRGECRHVTPIGVSLGKNVLHCYVDACDVGAGFLIYWQDAVVWEDAWVWKRSELRWHSNRKEALVLLAAHQVVADILACLGKRDSRWTVTFFGDNRSAVKWATGAAMDVSRKQERRSIARIIDAIREEQMVLREFSDITISHVPGPLNGQADRLSRLGERSRTPSSEKLVHLLDVPEEVGDPRSLIELLDATELGGEPELGLGGDPWEKWRAEEIDEAGNGKLHLSIPDCGNRSALLHIMDRVSLVSTVQSELIEGSGAAAAWAEQCAGDSYDISGVYRMSAVMRFVLRFWHANRKGKKSSVEYPEDWSEEDKWAVARSAQAMGLAGLPKNLKSEVGPLVFDPTMQVTLYKRPLPTGEYRHELFVPASCRNLQEKLVQAAHRAVGHMGADYTMAHVRGWWLHKGFKRAVEVLKYCLHCQRKNAGKQLGFKTDLQLVGVPDGPFQVLALDHLELGGKTTVLTSICLSTGFTVWAYCQSHSAKDTLAAFTHICNRLPKSPGKIFTDNSPVFPVLRKEYQKISGEVLEHESTPSYAQYQNGKLERLHRIGLGVLGSTSKLEMLEVEGHALEIQRILDRVTKVLNARPLACIYSDHQGNRFPVTPNLLVFGTAGALPIQDHSESNFELGRLQKWMDAFQKVYWGKLKEASYRSMATNAKKVTFAINEPVLFYQKSSKKLGFDFRIGIIRDIIDNHCQIGTGSKLVKVHTHNIVKLELRADVCRNKSDVTRVGATVCYTLAGVNYSGVVVEEGLDGSLLIRWDLKKGVGWPDEYLHASEVDMGN